MCTVTIIARKSGYALGMNRDEQLTRVAGLPPTLQAIDDRRIISPAEPTGGTWIALNDAGVTFALINWYSVSARVVARQISRGGIIRAVQTAINPRETAALLAEQPLSRINPFRLVVIFPTTKEVIEWRWNLKKLTRVTHGWQTQQWVSSGYDEPTAQRLRGVTFIHAQRQSSVGRVAWLRRLHGSHAPEFGPFSTCMHRADAATVSYTEVVVSARTGLMNYAATALCAGGGFQSQRFLLGDSRRAG
jgi:hypothetical protein